MRRRVGWLLLLLVVVVSGRYLQFLHDGDADPDNPADFRSHVHFHWNSLEYHGERFRVRRPYTSYEDYKDDPANLDPREFDRIEAVMSRVRFPASFRSREAFIDAIFLDLAFPGYGVGGGLRASTDDGSLLLVDGVEIPGHGKARVVVVRRSAGVLMVVDDFISSPSEHPTTELKLQSGVLTYFDDTGAVVRKTALPAST